MRRPSLPSACLIFGGLLTLCPVSHSEAPIPKPEPLWSTYLGGNASDSATAVTVDRFGNILLVGSTESTGWTSGGFDPTFNGETQDVFVAKLSPNGAHLWSTYLGGNNSDAGLAVVADLSGNVCVTGWTRSQGWTSGGFDSTYNGGFNDVFIAKLDPDGALLWSTYLGGNRSEMGEGIAVDSAGNLFITGWTSSPGWADGELTPSLTSAEAVDAFVAKISPAGVLLWSKYVGGGYPDFASDIALDSSGQLYLTGHSSYGFDPSLDPANDAFVMKLSATGGALWRTDLPGVGADQGTAVVVDASGTVYAVGSTQHPGWNSDAILVGHQGEIDAFVVQLSPQGVIEWTTHLGGGGEDHATDIAFDLSGDLILTGNTLSSGWTSGGFDSQRGGGTDAFLARLSPAGSELWSSYLGGSNEDYGESVAVDGSGGILAAGWTESAQWIADGFDVTPNGSFDGFIAKIVSEVDCPPATVDAKSLLLSCKGGILPGSPEGTLRLQFHAGASTSQSCTPVPLPPGAALVDCEIDPGQFSGLPDCEAVLSAMVAEIGACIEDQAGGLMSWTEISGAGLVIHSQVEFHALLVGSEVGHPENSGMSQPLGACAIYNLFDGVGMNESNLLAGYTGGLGLSLHAASCLPLPTPTPSNTPTETPTPTGTFTATPTPTATTSPTLTSSFTPSPSQTSSPTPTTPEMEPPTLTPTATASTTPTLTETPSETPTETPTSTETFTPTPTPDFDLEPDEVVNVKDLLLLLGGIRKGEDPAIDLFEFSAYWGN